MDEKKQDEKKLILRLVTGWGEKADSDSLKAIKLHKQAVNTAKKCENDAKEAVTKAEKAQIRAKAVDIKVAEAEALVEELQAKVQTDFYKIALEDLIKKGCLGQGKLKSIVQLDKLFRRRIGGLSAISKFITALAGIVLEVKEKNRPCCQINVFAYAFLKHAKNYHFFIRAEKTADINESTTKWTKQVQELEDFERLGTPLVNETIREAYLKLRAIVGHKSARDEQRTLACLLIAGPSTSEDIKEDLNLNYPLSLRIMAALVATGTIDEKDKDDEVLYSLNKDTLPIVLFLVRETIGLDVLGLMKDMEGENQ